MGLKLESPAFGAEDLIPVAYTCDGDDRSPPLRWTGAPADTKTFALIVDDPDAPSGTFVHWIAFNIPAARHDLPENLQHRGDMTEGTLQGRNDFGRVGYGGPCPPPGKPHRYYFRLYALRSRLNLSPGVTKADVDKAMQGEVLAQAELMARYGRSS